MKIIQNNTPLHNEYILHRISLIPLYIDNNSYKSLLFHMKVENKDHPVIKITSQHFMIYPLKKDVIVDNSIIIDNYDFNNPLSDEEKDNILRPYIYNSNKFYTLITELKSNKSKEDIQSLEIYAVPVLSSAKENASFQSVSNATFTYKIDQKMKDANINNMLKLKNIEDNPENRKDLELKYSERYYHIDDNNEPYWYNLNIESQHYQSPKNILKIACNLIIEQLNHFDTMLNKLDDEDSLITIKNKENLYSMIIENFDHTLSNIIQKHIVNKIISSNSIIQLCGYKKTHPLETILFSHSL